MKKRIEFLVIFAVVAGLMSFSALAGANDNVLKSATFSVLVDTSNDDIGTYQMRGFAASADGKYLYGGYLQGDRRVIRFDINTGAINGEWQDEQMQYPKGLASDDRGNLYVGLTGPGGKDPNGDLVVLDKDMNEISRVTVEKDDVFGFNGAAVQKLGDKYFAYFVMNYGPNAIYCYDVTDPKAPKLNPEFGEGGICDFVKLTGSEGEPSYLDIDTDGSIYISANVNAGGSKGDTLLHISKDGKSIISKASVVEAYGVAIFDDYVLVSTYNKDESCVEVVDKATMKSIGQIGKFDEPGNYNGVAVAGDVIYIDDAGRAGSADRILKSNKLAIVRPEPGVDEPEPEVKPDKPKNPVTSDDMLVPFALIALLAVSTMVIVSKKSKQK